jgi:hypothetical protein
MDIYNISRQFGIFYGHFGNFVVYFPRFGLLYQENLATTECDCLRIWLLI